MPHYNDATFIGHVGQQPDLKYMQDGTPVCNFSVAVNHPRKKDEPPMWVRVACWRGLAESVNQYVSKGDPVQVSGWLWLREYQRTDGGAGVSLDLEARSVVFLRGRDEVSPAPRDDNQDIPF